MTVVYVKDLLRLYSIGKRILVRRRTKLFVERVRLLGDLLRPTGSLSVLSLIHRLPGSTPGQRIFENCSGAGYRRNRVTCVCIIEQAGQDESRRFSTDG